MDAVQIADEEPFIVAETWNRSSLVIPLSNMEEKIFTSTWFLPETGEEALIVGRYSTWAVSSHCFTEVAQLMMVSARKKYNFFMKQAYKTTFLLNS